MKRCSLSNYNMTGTQAALNFEGDVLCKFAISQVASRDTFGNVLSSVWGDDVSFDNTKHQSVRVSALMCQISRDRLTHGTTPSRSPRWHVDTSETVRDGFRRERWAFWNRDAETVCIWRTLILRIKGQLVQRRTENKYQLHESSGPESKVFKLFMVSAVSAIDVKHVCTGQAAETGDLVKSGIRLLHPALSFTHSLSLFACFIKIVKASALWL